MNSTDFASRLNDFRSELLDEILTLFQSNRYELGNLTFKRWQANLVDFLLENAPKEGERLRKDINNRGMFAIARRNATPLENFLEDHGKFAEAFVSELIEASKKGRIEIKNGPPAVSASNEIEPTTRIHSIEAPIFVSYSHHDEEWLHSLLRILTPLIRDDKISVWSDKKISAGDLWRDEIKMAIDSAGVAILLVSDHFLASEFIANDELPPLLEASRSRGLRILWIPISHCLYNHTILSNYQAATSPKKPLDTLGMPEAKGILTHICQQIVTSDQIRL